MGTDRALVMDVDGVVSPVHGRTAWGDDVVAGALFGPVLVSPTLCARLDEIAAAPDLAGYWLTDWPPEARARMDPFPGRDWASIERPASTSTARTWTKWPALQAWLDDHPDLKTLVWCDDHLTRSRRATIRTRLQERGIRNSLIAPDTSVGLTPRHGGQRATTTPSTRAGLPRQTRACHEGLGMREVGTGVEDVEITAYLLAAPPSGTWRHL